MGRKAHWPSREMDGHTRPEAFLGDYHGRDQVVTGEMALDDSGKILAIRAKASHAVGAYLATAALIPVQFALVLIPNVYDVPALHLTSNGVFTNTSSLAPYRGAGRPEAIYLTERLIDLAAKKLAIGPIELRRRNFVTPDAMPHDTRTGFIYDSGEFAQLTDRCLEISDWGHYEERQKATAQAGKLRGRSFIYYIEDCGKFNERMELRFDPGGTVTIVAGTFSHGQGHETTYAQMVAEWLGVPFEQIRLVQGDTDKVSFGRGTFASRSAMLGGAALKMAADAIVERAKPLASHLLEASSGTSNSRMAGSW